MPEGLPPILVVDDREESRYISSRMLRKAGYAVLEARNGREALQMVLDNPALVILDVRLPDILGYEVCRRIKANPRTANIPVLQVSAAFTSSESRVQALDSGADAYLTQPLEPTVFIATVKGLLRLREAETISRLSAKQWQSTFDSLSEGIALLDHERRIVRCNRAMTELLGAGYQQIEKHDTQEIMRVYLDLNLADQDFNHIERDTQKGVRWFSVRINAIGDGETQRGYILVVAEITDRMQAEEALRVTERLAAMGRLANSIAHEINNPLEAVTNLLYLLKGTITDAESVQYLEMASSELDRVSRITKQTLAFNRETNQAIDIALPDLLDGLITLYGPQLSKSGISIKRKYCSPADVFAFPGELRQVFSNILRNAMEAIPQKGSITLHVYPSVDWKDMTRRGVRVSIFDNGSGIPPAIRKSIFEPFFTTKQLKGSGLGLWLSCGIIAKSDGRISLWSCVREGRSGTCFSIFLPAQGIPRSGKASRKRDAVA